MKRLLVAIALLWACREAYAQPTPVPGLKQVTSDDSLDGLGTIASPLKIRTCSDGFGLVYSTGSGTWVCSAAGSVDGSGTANYVTKWSDANTLTTGNLFDDGGTVIVRGGTGSAATVGGVHMFFNANAGHIYSTHPGTANRPLTIMGSTVTIQGDSVTALTITGNDGQFADTLGVTGLLTATAGVTTPANLTTTGTGQLVVAGNGSVAGNFTSGDAAGDVFDHNGDLAKFGSSDGYAYFNGNTVNAYYAGDADGLDFWVNWSGFNAGTTRDRDFIIGNGKNVAACTVTGSTKSMDCVGGLTENGVPALSGSITDNVIPMGTATGNLEDSALSYNGIDTVTSTAPSFVISTGAGAAPSHIFAQTGQTTWQLYEPASGNTFHLWNSVNGDVATWTTNDVAFADAVHAVGNLSTDANLTAGNATSDSHTINGRVAATIGGAAATPLTTSVHEMNVGSNSVIMFGESVAANANPHITLYRTASGLRQGTGARLFMAASNFDFRIQQGQNNIAYGSETYTDRVVIDVNGTGIGPDTTPDFFLDVQGTLGADGNVQLGDASTDRVGVGIAPDSNHAMTFAAALGPKIALYPVDSTHAIGFGVQSTGIQYITNDNATHHIFGYGDSDAFTATQRLATTGQVFFGDTANSSADSNLDVLTVGNTGTGQTADAQANLRISNTGSWSTAGGNITTFGADISNIATESAGANTLTNVALRLGAAGGDTSIGLVLQSSPTYQLQTQETTPTFDFNHASDSTLTMDNFGAGAFALTVNGPLTALRITPDTQLFDHSRGTEFFDDFTGSYLSSFVVSSTLFQVSTSGRWAACGNVSDAFNLDSTHMGIISLDGNTSTFTIGGVAAPRNARIVHGVTTGGCEGGVWFAGGGAAKGALLFYLPSANPPIDDSDSYTFHAGMFDGGPTLAATGAAADSPEDGIFCRASTASANWQTCTCESSTCTCNDTSPAVSITEDDWTKCEFTVNAAGTSITFTVTDTGAAGTATHTTNIPNDAGHAVGLAASVDLIDNAGFGAAYIDYAWFDQTFTTAR